MPKQLAAVLLGRALAPVRSIDVSGRWDGVPARESCIKLLLALRAVKV